MIVNSNLSSLLNVENLSSKIIQIYGEAATGKSTLAMSLSKLLNMRKSDYMFWIDTERKFSAKKYETLDLESKEPKEPIDRRQPFVTQLSTLKQQENAIKTIINSNSDTNPIFPVGMIVIDTFSNLLRKKFNDLSYTKYVNLTKDFIKNQINPLLRFQNKTDCYLIFVHQVTYVPDIGNLPFLHRVFSQIESAWIELSKDRENNELNMEIRNNNQRVETTFEISQKGLIFQPVS
ncbi:MAG: hypothetical protein GF364_04700 [Candidatus Lokiarchaeota archaeon]|nr:hypothetical protein [Candidatus Lokiarchaeota archaeon]